MDYASEYAQNTVTALASIPQTCWSAASELPGDWTEVWYLTGTVVNTETGETETGTQAYPLDMHVFENGTVQFLTPIRNSALPHDEWGTWSYDCESGVLSITGNLADEAISVYEISADPGSPVRTHGVYYQGRLQTAYSAQLFRK